MVETHSDHMVHRIRRRIAEDTTGELANLAQILFVRISLASMFRSRLRVR